MLFEIKRHWTTSLLVLCLLGVLALAGRQLANLHWTGLGDNGVTVILLAIGIIAASDFLIHGAASWLWPQYRDCYRQLLNVFETQRFPEFILAGLCASLGEELWFRGVVLESFRSAFDYGWLVGWIVSSVLFGALHWIPGREYRIFALWSIWEGALLGAVYLYSGSLLVAAIVHGVHDVAGFSFFAFERARTTQSRKSFS